MNSIPSIYEFLLWNNCKNSCEFCHQKANKIKYPEKFLTDENKFNSIEMVKQFILDKRLPNGSHILFMGGELFDTKLSNKTEKNFLELAELVSNKMLKNEIGFLYVNSNLIYTDTTLLYNFLNIFTHKKLEERIKFTTSYDFAYRYHDVRDRLTVENNMVRISSDYPNMSKVANCILTNKTCEFLSKNIDYISKFLFEFNFELNLIPYIQLHSYIAAKRSDILSLLIKIEEQYPTYMKRYMKNLSINQDRILLEYNGTEFKSASSKNAICGHNENFRKVYPNDSRCFICDCINLFNIL